jgi:transposase
MRGDDQERGSLFSYVSAERRIPKDHPLRPMRFLVDHALKDLSPEFSKLYSKMGRPSIPPERLLRALLLQILYTIRSERMLMEQLDYNLLFRWFVGLGMDDPIWDATTFTKNRERLLGGDVAQRLFAAVLDQARTAGLLSSEHFSVDGTLIDAWASHKSFQKREPQGKNSDDDPGNPTVNFRGEKRSNETHASKTDPEARLTRRKGHAAHLSYEGHVLTENRHGLVVQAKLTQASGFAERETALQMAAAIPGTHRVTLGADRGYDTQEFVWDLRELRVTPHVAQNTAGRASRIDLRTTRHWGYAESQRRRKRVEEVFGWMKTIGLMRKTRHRGTDRVGWMFVLTAAAYNLVRIRNLTHAV